ncbi:MAG: 50S ribosomal protein L10 [Flavobacteriales bacterium]|nr:50S ribosomal protein L10 [Flavobacteriales bacterium]
MTKQEKAVVIEELKQILIDNNTLYITDIEGLDADSTSQLRRNCFKNKVSIKVVKNTLLKKAMEQVEEKDYSELFTTLKGNTTILLSETANAPAKLIKSFRGKSDKPILKSAWIDSSVYIGDNQIETLANLKSKEELIGDIIGILQSPIKNVVSALQSGGSTIAGIVKTLSEKE